MTNCDEWPIGRKGALPAALCAFALSAGCAQTAPPTAGLDALPEGYFETMDRYAKAAREEPSSEHFGVADVVWRKPVVTVAFNGGDEKVRALIEATAKEWTAHGGAFNFSFRDGAGAFRQWSESDVASAADIRISFAGGGYWSLLGTMASAAYPEEPTMGLAGFDERLALYVDGANADGWRVSYERLTILHEFGHALGLAHEHFHPDCQPDIKLAPDDGYVEKTRARVLHGKPAKEYLVDDGGRSPGALLYFSGWPNGWNERNIRHNINAESFLANSELLARSLNIVREGISSVQSRAIDRRSVMLYSMSPHLYRSGGASACIPTGEGVLADGRRHAVGLSEGDIKYFKLFYE
jgi:hypothetical protein